MRPPSKKPPAGSPVEDILARQLSEAGVPGVIRQFPWGEVIGRRFTADFAIPAENLLVEVQGASWSGGRHVSGGGYEADRRKAALASILGWSYLEVVTSQVKSGEALALIKAWRAQGEPGTKFNDALGVSRVGLSSSPWARPKRKKRAA